MAIQTQRGMATWCAICSEVGFGSLTEEEKVWHDALGGTVQEMLTSPEVAATSKNHTSFSHEDQDLQRLSALTLRVQGASRSQGSSSGSSNNGYSMALSWCSASDKGSITYQLGNL